MYDKWYCEYCGRVFRSSEEEPSCPECGCKDGVEDYEGQDELCGDDVFDMVDTGVIPNV